MTPGVIESAAASVSFGSASVCVHGGGPELTVTRSE
jgi:hypothetical protein